MLFFSSYRKWERIEEFFLMRSLFYFVNCCTVMLSVVKIVILVVGEGKNNVKILYLYYI